MAVLDTFLYDGEAWALRLRVAELAPLGDVVHCALLANRTHQGDPREPAELIELQAEAHAAGAQVVGIADLSVYDDRGRGGAGRPDYQVRERLHRDELKGLAAPYADAGDLFLVSDVDEIPASHVVRLLAATIQPREVVVCSMVMFVWSPQWRYPGPWLGTTAARWPVFHSPQQMRDARGTPRAQELSAAGWHLTWMGSPAARVRKLRGFSHAELAGKEADLADLADVGIDINGLGLSRVDPARLPWPGGLAWNELGLPLEASA